MSSGIRGIFLDPIHPNIQKRIEIETTHYQNKDPQIFQKTPWIRLTSNAQDAYQGETKLNYQDWVLSGTVVESSGTPPYNKQLSGWSESEYGSLYSPERRNTARPGVTNVVINQKGKLGSIQKATINITIPYEQDLEIIEKFYMVPGVTCVLEWGWSDYSGDVLRLEDSDNAQSIQKKILEKILALSSNQSSFSKTLSITDNNDNTAGKYGAMLGVIYKFGYSSLVAGGYNATVELMAPTYFLAERPISTNYFPDLPPIKTETIHPTQVRLDTIRKTVQDSTTNWVDPQGGLNVPKPLQVISKDELDKMLNGGGDTPAPNGWGE